MVADGKATQTPPGCGLGTPAANPTNQPFVVVSGIPASGKTMLGRGLAAALGLPLIDKDELLEDLFQRNGTGDAAWRRKLSRESDALLQAAAAASSGAVLVSFWRVQGMPEDSGTPTEWLPGLTDRLVHVHCACPPALAAARFLGRRRHPGHLDDRRSPAEVLRTMRNLARLGPPRLGSPVLVDTSVEIRLASVVHQVARALARPAPMRRRGAGG